MCLYVRRVLKKLRDRFARGPRGTKSAVDRSDLVYLPGRRFFYFLLDLIRGASNRIYIAVYVARRGVFVDRVLDAIIESRAPKRVVVLEKRVGKRFMKSNSEVIEYLRCRGVDAGFTAGANVQHMKVYVVDDWVVIGSHNLTDAALMNNDEISVAIRSRELADRVVEDVEKLRRGIRIGVGFLA